MNTGERPSRSALEVARPAARPYASISSRPITLRPSITASSRCLSAAPVYPDCQVWRPTQAHHLSERYTALCPTGSDRCGPSTSSWPACTSTRARAQIPFTLRLPGAVPTPAGAGAAPRVREAARGPSGRARADRAGARPDPRRAGEIERQLPAVHPAPVLRPPEAAGREDPVRPRQVLPARRQLRRGHPRQARHPAHPAFRGPARGRTGCCRADTEELRVQLRAAGGVHRPAEGRA